MFYRDVILHISYICQNIYFTNMTCKESKDPSKMSWKDLLIKLVVFKIWGESSQKAPLNVVGLTKNGFDLKNIHLIILGFQTRVLLVWEPIHLDCLQTHSWNQNSVQIDAA